MLLTLGDQRGRTAGGSAAKMVLRKSQLSTSTLNRAVRGLTAANLLVTAMINRD